MRFVMALALAFFSFSMAFDKTVINNKFKDFRCIYENGEMVKAFSKIEGKPAVVIFFAIGDKVGTFDFLPKVNRLYDKYKKDVNFLAILLSRFSVKNINNLKKFLPLKMPVCLAYREAIREYGLLKVDVPTILIIDEKGNIRHIIVRPESSMVEIIPPQKYSPADTLDKRIENAVNLIDTYIQKTLKRE